MKFHTEDRRYLTARAAYSEESGPRELWSVVDHWPLYCGIANLGRYLAIGDLLRSTLQTPGDLAEFGTWRGATLMLLTKLLRIFDPHGPKVVHCFDTFEGLEAFSTEDREASARRGEYRGSLAELEAMIDLYQLQDDIDIHRGLVEETLPELLERRPELTFSFVYCDTDLYASTRTIVDLVPPRLSPGGLIVFDEWNDESFPGEGVAANELIARAGPEFEVRSVLHARQPTLVLRRSSAES